MAQYLSSLTALLVFTACTIGPIYSLRLRMAPPVTGQLIDDYRVSAAFVLTYFACIIAGVVCWRIDPQRAERRRLNMIAFISLGLAHVLVLTSAAWSLVPERTITQGCLFVLTTIAAYIIGRWVSVRLTFALLFLTHQILLAISVWAVERAWPGAVDPRGDWTGIFLNKNSLGPVAAVAILSTSALLAFYWPVLASRPPAIRFGFRAATLAVVALDGVLLMKADSITAVVGVVFALTIGSTAWWIRRRGSARLARRIGYTFGGVFVAAIGAVAIGRFVAGRLLDRSPTLSGRTELWSWLMPRVGERPIGGWGWLSVWEEPVLRRQVVQRFHVPFATAHNGLLEVAIGAGPFAALCVLIASVCLIGIVVGWCADHRSAHEFEPIAALAICAYAVAVNQLETFVGANLLPWALLVAMGVAAAYRRNGSTPVDKAIRPPTQ